MLLVSPVALLTRPRIPVSVCFPTGISSCAWLSFLLHMKIPINGMLAITLSLIWPCDFRVIVANADNERIAAQQSVFTQHRQKLVPGCANLPIRADVAHKCHADR